MIAASHATQRPVNARLLVVDECGQMQHALRSGLIRFLRSGDLVIANDAATLPASLMGFHLRSGSPIEIRLAGRESLDPADLGRVSAIVFGAGDYHARTEDRPLPPLLRPDDHLVLGPLLAIVERLQDHPRLLTLRFENPLDEIWSGLASHGRPIQYSHVGDPLALWDVWTPIAGPPVAFEPPSAGFALSWSMLAEMRARNIDFATLTHAAGISSTGDPELDLRLPFDEPYRIPQVTVTAIEQARAAGGRIIAVGTTVVRALEHAAGSNGVLHAGDGIANQRIGPETHLQIVDAILSGTHEPGSSHYDLLGAFVNDSSLRFMTEELESREYRTHEFGDSVLIQQSKCAKSLRPILGLWENSVPAG